MNGHGEDEDGVEGDGLDGINHAERIGEIS